MYVVTGIYLYIRDDAIILCYQDMKREKFVLQPKIRKRDKSIYPILN